LIAKVIRPFIDKNTHQPYHRDGIYESDDQERIQVLQSGGFLAGVVETETKTEEQTSEATSAGTDGQASTETQKEDETKKKSGKESAAS